MFTLQQIKAAHSKVKSGADFPAYIQDIQKLGVTYYETFVSSGHSDYHGENSYKIQSGPGYAELTIAAASDPETFKAELKAHQQGKTGYMAFCEACARTGIEKWCTCLETMTCTYYDLAGNKILTEEIPH